MNDLKTTLGINDYVTQNCKKRVLYKSSPLTRYHVRMQHFVVGKAHAPNKEIAD